MGVTEVGCMGVKPGLSVMDPATPEGQILTGAWKTVTTKPGGPSHVYWGLETENPSRLWAFFDWVSVEQHKTFAEEYGAEAVKNIPKICIPGESSKHLQMVPSSDVFLSPITEIMMIYFPEDVSEAARDEVAIQLRRILAEKFEKVPGVVKMAQGWGMESNFLVRGDKEEYGSVLMAFIGWSDSEAQGIFHETEAFKDATKAMTSMSEVIGYYNFSINCDHMERSLE